MTKSNSLKPDSLLVAAGRDDSISAPLNVPLVPASNYILGGSIGYSRDDATPTWNALEAIVGGIEQAHCVAFSSGMAAIAAIFSHLKQGAIISLPDDCYQGVAGLAQDGADKGFWQCQRIPVEATSAWVEACKTSDLIWLESPSNPLLKIAELDIICSAEKKPGALIVVDNTLATALNQKPLDMGADIAVQSATKFIGGHSDLLSGVVTTKQNGLSDSLRNYRSLQGATPGNLETFLASRGARTLALRLEKAQSSAMRVAQWLNNHPCVTKVRYPGLTSHPQHEVAKRLLTGFGTMISFDLTGTAESTDEVCSRVTLIRHATSLGGVESTMERRAAVPGQTHLPPTMLRLCIGIEHVDDLIADLDNALANVSSKE